MLIIENTSGNKLDILKYAIENKYSIVFWYRGVKLGDPNEKGYTRQNYRRVEPVALGKSDKTGKDMLRAFQYNGATNTKNQVYKTFIVDEIKDGSIQMVYDSTGKQLRTFDTNNQRYTDKNGNTAEFRSNGDDLKMASGRSEKYVDTSKPAGPTDPKYANMNYKEPEIKNKPEQKPVEPQAQGQNVPENPDDKEVVNEHSSGFLKWIYNIYG
jgi:hypothetical protein